MAVSGLNALAGYNAISNKDPFATGEQRMGGPANPYHSQVGEQAVPYSWQSQAMPGGKIGPMGTENQLLDDEFWFLESAGTPEKDPTFDYNMPNLTRSHGSVKNITLSGPIPDQAGAIHLETMQMENKGSDLNTKAGMQETALGDVTQDNWLEIWNVNNGSDDYPPDPTKQIATAVAGYGTHDRTSNPMHKRNEFEFDSKHMHRRYAWSSIPGNYLWMIPGGRPLFKSIPGTAKPPIGPGSQFEGQDLGFAFSYDTGAVLMDTPQEYVPPPAPNIATYTPQYASPMGTDAIDLW